jgi:archaellin
MLYNKPSVIGNVRLLIFTAIILGASFAAAVIITTAGNLQQEGTISAQDVQRTASTKLHVLNVVGQDGRDEDIELICENIKLAPGSAPVKIDESTLILETADIYRPYIMGFEYEGNLNLTNSFQPSVEYFDIDNDELPDTVRLIQQFLFFPNDFIEVQLSSDGTLRRFMLPVDLDAAAPGNPIQINAIGEVIATGETEKIYMTIVGTTTQSNTIPDDAIIALATDDNAPSDAGVYTFENTHSTNNNRVNIITKSTVGRLCFGTTPIPTETSVKIHHILGKGHTTIVEFNTPDIMSMQKIDLYPWYEG